MSLGNKNISLVGFMGTGKSSVGKALAKKLGRPLVDIDRLIEEDEERKISDIFEKDGEPYFRKLEKAALESASKRQGLVITTGGGAMLDPQNIETLRRSGWLICLSAKPETIYERVKDTRHRPLLKGGDVLSEIRRLMEIRQPFYAKADFYFQTDGRTAEEVASEILETLEK